MVGFLRHPTVDEELNQQPSEPKKSNDPFPIDLSFTELDELSLSFADSLLDFDCIGDWIEETPVMDMADSNPESAVKVVEGCLGVDKDESCRETGFGDGFQELGNLNALVEGNPVLNPDSEKVDSVKIEVKAVEGCVAMEKDGSRSESGLASGFQKLGHLSSSIEEEIGKFSLDGGSDENGRNSSGILVTNSSKSVEPVSLSEDGISGQKLMVHGEQLERGEKVGINEGGGSSGEMITVNGDGQKSNETESDGDESDSTSDSSSVASSSSSSSSEEEEEEEEEEGEEEEEEAEEEEDEELVGEIDMEEGEIRDSELEQMVGLSDDEDEDGSVAKGPIRSKNELQVLPPVPPVNVTLQPHHQTQPVGVILSIIGTQVIVEGIEKHNPLSDGSILWITESRSPLGMVDEIFGPVKNPYYMIRYNSENDIPSGIQQGTPISFVPEFANHVLNDSSLYRKGYDASGENDEEVTDEAEFSDDEKEAEYKRMLKMSKRGTNGPNPGNKKKERKKFNNRGGTWQQNSQPSTLKTVEGSHQLPTNQNQQLMFNNQIQQFTHDHGNSSHLFGPGQGFAGNPGLVPPFQAPGFIPPSSGVWTNGMPFEQQSMGFPFRVPTNGMPWLQQNQQQQQSFQMPFPNGMPFQQQFNTGQMFPPNVGAQPNFGPGPAFAPWPGCLGQSGLTQPLGVGWQAQQSPMSMNVGEQPRPLIPSNAEVPREFNQGMNRGRGRKPFHRAGGRLGGGRGQRQSK